MKFNAFLKECNKKDVFRMLSIYIVSSWLLIQVLAVIWEPLGLPSTAVTYLLIILLVAFPIYIFYIWKFRLIHLEGEPQDLDGDGIMDKSLFQRMYFSSLLIISLISAGFVGVIVNHNFIDKVDLSTMDASDKIAILQFGNNTGDEKLDVVSKMASDWIMHGITENKIAQVVSPEVVLNYTNLLKVSKASIAPENILKDYFKPKKTISGNFFLKGNQLLFQSSIQGENSSYAFKIVECYKENPLECIESLKQLILGYLITEDQGSHLGDSPPIFEAYQAVLDARNNYQDNNDKYLELLDKAISLDSNYFEPKMLKISITYNMGDFKKADSLRRSAVKSTAKINNRQRNLLNFYEALLNGNNRAAYNAMKKEYNLSQFNLQSNKTMMTLTLQFVNKPQAIDSIYSQVTTAGIDIDLCFDCEDRLYMKALSDLELKRYGKVIELLTPFADGSDKLFFKRPLIKAYINSGDLSRAKALLTKLKLIVPDGGWQKTFVRAGREFLLANQPDQAAFYFNEVASASYEKASENQANAYYYLSNYKDAEPIYKTLHFSNSKDFDIITKLAVCYYKNGKITEAQELIASLGGLREDYQYGSIDYAIAQYYAAINDEQKAMKFLFLSVASGNFYTSTSFQNDPHFKPYLKTDMFNQILKFWHN